MIKKITLALILITALSIESFAAMRVEYKFKLDKVEIIQTDNLTTLGTITGDSYNDSIINIQFFFERVWQKHIGIHLNNVSFHELRISWDNAIFISENNTASRVTLGNISYLDINNPIKDEIIPIGTGIRKNLLPQDNVYFSSSTGVHIGALVYPDVIKKKKLESLRKEKIGKQISIIIPIIQDGITYNYKFTFSITDVILH